MPGGLNENIGAFGVCLCQLELPVAVTDPAGQTEQMGQVVIEIRIGIKRFGGAVIQRPMRAEVELDAGGNNLHRAGFLAGDNDDAVTVEYEIGKPRAQSDLTPLDCRRNGGWADTG